MAEFPGYFRYCLNTGKLLLLAVLVSGGVVLHILVSIFFSHLYKCEAQRKQLGRGNRFIIL